MLISLKNIKEYVSLDGLSANKIADDLTFAGIEVEEVSCLASGTNLVIGEIIECEKHPDSDHLHVLKVNLGEKYGVEQIVCGAPNARKGLKVIVARVGAKLPQIEIKAGVIRGVASNGMCCSLLELGVDAKYLTDYQKSGIEELDNDAIVGNEDVLGYLGLDDEVLNLKVLANRPDLLSIYNVAREIGAIYQREVKIPSYKEKDNFVSDIKIGSETNKCSQFAIREIRGIETKKSPKWLSNYLTAMGIRSINNIVDIGNYVMLLTGQPLHMYDLDKFNKKELIVKDNLETSFVALDEKTYQIKKGDIVITSDNKIMCLGGIMGSKDCAVDVNTKNVYIESASFDGATIRHCSNRLGLVSESSQRFVKGTNHFQAEEVINFASYLLKTLASSKEFSDIKNYQSERKVDLLIKSSTSRINGRLGTQFNKEDIKNVLENLNFEFKDLGNEEFEVKVPSYRLDISCDADISEEVIRLLGYDNVKSALPCLDTHLGSLTLKQERLREIRRFLLDKGLDECLTYSLVSCKESKMFNLLNNEETFTIINPLTDERTTFRSHILHSLLKVAAYNVSRQFKDLMLFETSNVQTKQSIHSNLAIVLLGNKLNRGLMNKESFDFFDLKGIVEGIFSIIGIESSRYKFERLTKNFDELHPGKSCEIYFQNKLVGVMGELHPNMIKEYDLGKTNAVVLEMNLDEILEAKVSVTKMSLISKYPFVSRDLAFVVDKNVDARDIIKTIKVTGKGIVSEAYIFDIYEGQNIEPNKKSVAVSIIYMSNDHTLSDKEVSDTEDKIKFELFKNFKCDLRV